MSLRFAEPDRAPSRNSSTRGDRNDRPSQGRRSREQSPAWPRPDLQRPANLYPQNSPSTPATTRSNGSGRPAPTRKSTARRRYPPTPYVEDVPRSMAEKTDHFEAPTPGVKDQYPIVISLEEEKRTFEPQKSSHRGPKRDSKMYTSARNSRTTAHPGGASKQDMQRPSTPQSSSRPSSPSDLWTPTSSVLTNDSGYYSSSTSGSKTPTGSTEKRRGVVFGEDQVSDISTIDAEMRRSLRKKPATTYPNVGSSSLQGGTPREPAKFAVPRLSDIKAGTNESSGRRRASDLSSTTIRPDLSDIAQPVPQRRREDVLVDRTRPTSPASTIGSSHRSPPESPRRTSKTSYFDMPQPHSPRSSISGSVSGSRPSSPSALAYPSPRSDDDFISPGPRRAATFPAKFANPKRASSVLSDPPMYPDDMPSSRNRSIRQSSNASSPYPVTNMLSMPSVEEHAYRPNSKDDMEMPRVSASAKATGPVSIEVPKPRPGLSSRNTATGALPSLKTGLATVLGSSHMMSSPTSISTASPMSSRKSARSCWQKASSEDARDWRHLPGFAGVKMCPACAELRFRGTPFEQEWRPLQRDARHAFLVCCFISPWYRTAYDLTTTRKAGNLRLFERLARADDGDTHGSGDRWHKLEPERGATSSIFLCPREAAKMRALFPYVRDSFTETSTRQIRSCSMHLEGSRLETYLALMQEADAKAEYSSRPRLDKLLDHSEKMSKLPECSGDNLVAGVRWHHASGCTQLTVCRDCFVNMVYPKIKDGSRAAERIRLNDRYVEGEHPMGTACQLWSPRMRRVFASAVKNDDFEYLAERVKERVKQQRQTASAIDKLKEDKAWLLRKQASDGRAGVTKKQLADVEYNIDALKEDFEYGFQ